MTPAAIRQAFTDSLRRRAAYARSIDDLAPTQRVIARDVFRECAFGFHAIDRRRTRSTAPHAHVVDLFVDGPPARCVCIDCWQSWPEAAEANALPATCGVPSSVVLAVDPSWSTPNTNPADSTPPAEVV